MSDLRKKFFTLRVVKQRNSSAREAVAAPSLEVFKAKFNSAWSSLV